MNLQNLLDEAKTICGETSDSGLARRLGVKRQTVSNWRHGMNLPDVVACEQLAKLTGKTVISVIAAVGEQRERASRAKAVWRRIANAAAVVLATGMAAWNPAPAANFPTNGHAEQGAGVCIMRNLRRWCAALDGRFRQARAWWAAFFEAGSRNAPLLAL